MLLTIDVKNRNQINNTLGTFNNKPLIYSVARTHFAVCLSGKGFEMNYLIFKGFLQPHKYTFIIYFKRSKTENHRWIMDMDTLILSEIY